MPLQPPDAVQEVVFDELHVRFDAAPLLTLLGDALIDAEGGGAEGDEPPPPQDISSRSDAAVARSRLENCMRYRRYVLRICVTVSIASCNSMRGGVGADPWTPGIRRVRLCAARSAGTLTGHENS